MANERIGTDNHPDGRRRYAKPPPLDEQIAEQARFILQLLFAVHVATCFLFYARAARHTDSLWGPQQIRPFTLGIIIMVVYFVFDGALASLPRV